MPEHEQLPSPEELDQCIKLLRKNGIKLVVFDMDLTAASEHSRGKLLRSAADEYISKATPAFLVLVPELHKHGFYLAIATHSDEAEFGLLVQPKTHILGKELATRLVTQCFSPKISESFYIVAYNPRVHPEDEAEETKIKRYHMRKLRENFGVEPEEIAFFDDTESVIADCRDFCGVTNSYQVDPSWGFRISDLTQNFS